MAKTWKGYKEESRKNPGDDCEEGDLLYDSQIQLGAILRIADAAEKMALNYDVLRKFITCKNCLKTRK